MEAVTVATFHPCHIAPREPLHLLGAPTPKSQATWSMYVSWFWSTQSMSPRESHELGSCHK